MKKKKNNNTAKMTLIYIRYLIPVALCLAVMGTLFIPCLQYSTVEGTQSKISAAELMENSWDQVRAYLFATSEREITQERFSWTVLILLPLLILLFCIGVISSVAVAIGALRYINDIGYRKTDARIWFITILPNRIVVCILQLFILPMLFYSRLMVPLYAKILHMGILLNTSFPEPWVWGIIACAVIILLSIISARFEKELDADPFKKIAPPVIRVVDRDSEESEKKEPVFKDEAERIYYENQKRARDEQAERIKKLLNKNDEEEN